jgi:uncharacterized damage-inducible protein DinB
MNRLLIEYTRYNVWANNEWKTLLEQQPEEVLLRPAVSSFPNILKTVEHLWGAEWLWLERLQGRSHSKFPAGDFARTPQEVLSVWVQTSKDFSAFAERQLPNFFEQILAYSNLKGDKFSSPADEMIHHCMNHSTYHRGQLTTLARQAGLE